MNKLLIPGLLLLLCMAACRKPDDVLCFSEPASSSVRFRLLDSVSGEDLILSGQLKGIFKDSLKAQQPCFPDPLMSRFSYYQVPGGGSGYSFDFPNLPNPKPDAADNCFSIILRWNQQDVDTIRWHYHMERIENCELQILDRMEFNGAKVQKFNDGIFEYYALRK